MGDESVKVSGGILLVRSKSGTNKIHKVLVHTRRGKGKNQVKCRLQRFVPEKRRSSKIPVFVKKNKTGIGRNKVVRSLHTSVASFSETDIHNKDLIVENPPQERSLHVRDQLSNECSSAIKSSISQNGLRKGKKYLDSGIGTGFSDKLSSSCQVLHLRTKHYASNQDTIQNDSELVGYDRKCCLNVKENEVWSPSDSDNSVHLLGNVKYKLEQVFENKVSSFYHTECSDNDVLSDEERVSFMINYKQNSIEEIVDNRNSTIRVSGGNDEDFGSEDEEKTFLQPQKRGMLSAEPHTIVMSQYKTTMNTNDTKTEESSYESEESSVESWSRFIDSGLRPLKLEESKLFLEVLEERHPKSQPDSSEEDGVHPLLRKIQSNLFQPNKPKTKTPRRKPFHLPSAATLSVNELTTSDLEVPEDIDPETLKRLQEYEDTTFTIETGDAKPQEEEEPQEAESIGEPEEIHEPKEPDSTPEPGLPTVLPGPAKPVAVITPKPRVVPPPEPAKIPEPKEPERPTIVQEPEKPQPRVVPQPEPAKIQEPKQPERPTVIQEPEKPDSVKKPKPRVVPQPEPAKIQEPVEPKRPTVIQEPEKPDSAKKPKPRVVPQPEPAKIQEPKEPERPTVIPAPKKPVAVITPKPRVVPQPEPAKIQEPKEPERPTIIQEPKKPQPRVVPQPEPAKIQEPVEPKRPTVIQEPEKPDSVKRLKPRVVPQPEPAKIQEPVEPKRPTVIQEPEKPDSVKKSKPRVVPQPEPVKIQKPKEPERPTVIQEPEKPDSVKKPKPRVVPQPAPKEKHEQKKTDSVKEPERPTVIEEPEKPDSVKKRKPRVVPQPEPAKVQEPKKDPEQPAVVREPEEPGYVKKRKRRVVPPPTDVPEEKETNTIDALTGSEDCLCPHYHGVKKAKKKKSIFKFFKGDFCFHASEPSDQGITSTDMSCSSIPIGKKKKRSKEKIKTLKPTCSKSRAVKTKSGDVAFVVEECSSGRLPKTSTVKKKTSKVKPSSRTNLKDKRSKTGDKAEDNVGSSKIRWFSSRSREDEPQHTHKPSRKMKASHQKHSQGGRSMDKMDNDIRIFLPDSSAVLIPEVALCGKSSCRRSKSKETKQSKEPSAKKHDGKDLKHKHPNDEETRAEGRNRERRDKPARPEAAKKGVSGPEPSTPSGVGENKESQKDERAKSSKDKLSKSKERHKSHVHLAPPDDDEEMTHQTHVRKDKQSQVEIILPDSFKKEPISRSASNVSLQDHRSKSLMSRTNKSGLLSSKERRTQSKIFKKTDRHFVEASPKPVGEVRASTIDGTQAASRGAERSSKAKHKNRPEHHVQMSPLPSMSSSNSSLSRHVLPSSHSVLLLSNKERRKSKILSTESADDGSGMGRSSTSFASTHTRSPSSDR